MIRPSFRPWLPIALAVALSAQTLGFWLLLAGGRQWGYGVLRPAALEQWLPAFEEPRLEDGIWCVEQEPPAIDYGPSTMDLAVLRSFPGSEPIQRIGRDEIHYRSEFYDIVHTERRGDTMLYFCRHDTWESRLFSWADRWFSTLPDHQAPALFHTLLPLPAILPVPSMTLPVFLFAGIGSLPIFFTPLLASREQSPPSPPPEVGSVLFVLPM